MQAQRTKSANPSLTKVTATTAASNAVSGQSTSEALTGDSGWQVFLKLAKKKLRVEGWIPNLPSWCCCAHRIQGWWRLSWCSEPDEDGVSM